jgi:hypothetical protein
VNCTYRSLQKISGRPKSIWIGLLPTIPVDLDEDVQVKYIGG